MLNCMEAVLDAGQLDEARTLVRACEFADGKRTAGRRARRVKHNEQLRRGTEQRDALNALLLGALKSNARFRSIAHPRRIATPLVSRYTEGMTYGAHVDDAIMGDADKMRTDLAVTIFLADPGDYDGGELFIGASYGQIAVKLPAGDAVVYAADTIHRVAPVTRGERLVAVTWVQSFVRCPRQRELLLDLERVRRRLEDDCPDTAESDLAGRTYSNLLRMWVDA